MSPQPFMVLEFNTFSSHVSLVFAIAPFPPVPDVLQRQAPQSQDRWPTSAPSRSPCLQQLSTSTP